MTLAVTDIALRQSISTASAGDAVATVNGLGKYASQTLAPATVNGVFDKVTQAQNAASQVDYRCVFVVNLSTTDTLIAAKVWVTAVSGGAAAAIGVDPAGVKALTSAVAQAATIASTTTAPAGVTFTAPTSYATGLAVGDLGPRQCVAVWVRRSALASGAMSADGVDISVQGTTP